MVTKVYKLIFDLGICFSLGAFLFYYIAKSTLHVGLFLFLVISASISLLLKEKRKQDMLPTVLLPLIGGLILRPAWIELLVYVPIWGYVIYMLISDRLTVGRGEFLDRVRKLLYLCLILPIFMLAELRTFGDAIGAALPYMITTLVSIVFMLRHLRTLERPEGQKVYYLQQMWEMLIFLTVCVLLTIIRAPQNLLVGIQLLYNGLIRPILSFIVGLIVMIFGGIVSLISSLLSFSFDSRQFSQRNDELLNRLTDIPELTQDTVVSKTWLISVLYSIGAILVIIALFTFFRWLIGDRGNHKLPAGVAETREMLEDAGASKKFHRLKYSKEPAERIRYYYLKYLLHLRFLKVTVLSGDTTREVDLNYSKILPEQMREKREASKALKKLYRKARYQEQQELTAEEEEQAKRLYRIIKSKKE